jgi:hypothetical protein
VKTDFVFGAVEHSTLGSSTSHVIGQNYTITTHPGAVLQYTAGGESSQFFQGFVVGTGVINLSVGGRLLGRYGAEINVVRGPRITVAESSNALATAALAILDGISICASLGVAMLPDPESAKGVFGAARFIETITLGLLTGLESTLAWVKQAEVNTKLAGVIANLYQEALTKAFTMITVPDIAKEVATFVRNSAMALKGEEVGALVHNCKAYRLSAEVDASIAVHGDGGMLWVVSDNIRQVGHDVRLGARDSFTAFSTGVAMLSGGRQTTVSAGPVNLGSRIELTDRGITMQVGNNIVELNNEGFTLNTLQIKTKTNSQNTEAGVANNKVTGLRKETGGMQELMQ